MKSEQRPCWFCDGFIVDDGVSEVGVHQTHCPELGVPVVPAEVAIAAMISELA